jgi:hypothetical protein
MFSHLTSAEGAVALTAQPNCCKEIQMAELRGTELCFWPL